MDIIVGDVNSRIETDDERILPIVRTVCRARPAGYYFMPKYKQGVWDGYISLMSSHTEFPSGLVPFVVEELESRGYTNINQVQESTNPITKLDLYPGMLNGITLRDYQMEAAITALQNERGILKMATNAGKTEVMAAILKAINAPSIVLVDSKDLLYQTAQRISQRLGVDVGLVGDGNRDIQKITVATIQTLQNLNHVEYFATNVAIFIDECHHGSSDQHLHTVMSLPGHYRFGFSGTPLKNDILSDMRLISITGPVIYETTNDYMIEQGYSAKPLVTFHSVYSDDREHWHYSYPDAYKHLIVEFSQRNDIINNIAQSNKDKVVLIIVNRIQHGNILMDMVDGAKFVHGSDTMEHRNHILHLMRTTPGVYIATSIFDEGIDVPNIEVLIMAAGGKSDRELLQRVGRGLRAKSGANILHVHDFIDDTNRHLLKHTEERLDVYVSEGFDVTEATDG